jgi:pathogenesis-related protein 1
MDRRIVTLLITATLAGCGAAGEADAAPCVPLGAGKPTGPNAAAQAFLDAHNLVRSGCGVTISPAPAPSLPLLEWSSSAAAVAQAWANNCSWSHNPVRNPDGVARGENIAASSPDLWDEAGVVGAWASEWVGYNYAGNTCTPPSGVTWTSCGHYTQLVWRSTLRIGCGYKRCTVNSPFQNFTTWDFFVCDYEPPGNVSGQKPY